jgi:hypothetical protein
VVLTRRLSHRPFASRYSEHHGRTGQLAHSSSCTGRPSAAAGRLATPRERLRSHEVFVGEYKTPDEVAKVVDLAQLVEDDAGAPMDEGDPPRRGCGTGRAGPRPGRDRGGAGSGSGDPCG